MRCQRAGRRSEVNSREEDGGSRAPWEARESSARSAQRDNRATRHAAAPHRSATPPRESRDALRTRPRTPWNVESPTCARISSEDRNTRDTRASRRSQRDAFARDSKRNARTTRLVTRRLRASRNSRNETPPRATATQGVTDSRTSRAREAEVRARHGRRARHRREATIAQHLREQPRRKAPHDVATRDEEQRACERVPTAGPRSVAPRRSSTHQRAR